jgi:ABC-type transport system involved in cytochrome bd biosynthesis fused ATPase/permease subunit
MLSLSLSLSLVFCISFAFIVPFFSFLVLMLLLLLLLLLVVVDEKTRRRRLRDTFRQTFTDATHVTEEIDDEVLDVDTRSLVVLLSLKHQIGRPQ